MKKMFTVFALFFAAELLLTGCASAPQAGGGSKRLDQAIAEAATKIDADIQKGSKIALLNFNSPSQQFSSYVLDELTANLLDTKKLIVVDRKEVDLILSEFNFQFSGNVGDDSIQELGRMLGAQAIVSGSLTKIGNDYRIVIRVLNVQSAAVAVQYRTDIVNDSRVKALLAGSKTGGESTAGGQVNIGDRLATGALNILAGLGSYLEKDITGGISITAGYAAAAGLFVLESALDWENPAVGIPGTAGFSVLGVTFVYGFVRPFLYAHSPKLTAILDNIQPAIVNTNAGFTLTYTHKF